MRSIAIVGGGQAGFPLAFGLLGKGYDVTIVTNRDADAVRSGRIMSSQCMFATALQIERDLGLNLWEAQCPTVDGIGLTVPHPELPGATLINWSARLDVPAQAVDQRIKMPAFMALFEQRGGKLMIEDVGVAELERLAQSHDLVIVAAGKGEVAKLFERDAARSCFSQPMRALALTYVTGMTPQPDYSRVAFNLVPGIGEYFTFPGLTTTGPCDIMFIEAIPGGPFDCFGQVRDPQQQLAQTLALLQIYLPWEAQRARHVALTDAWRVVGAGGADGTAPRGHAAFGRAGVRAGRRCQRQ